MKVILLHYAAPPVVGGVESVLNSHARLMADAGHSVRILAGRGEQTDPRVEFFCISEIDSRHPEVLAAKSELDRGKVPEAFETLVHKLQGSLQQHFKWADVVIAHNVASLHKNLALTAAIHSLWREAVMPRLILWHHDLAYATPRYQSEIHPGYPWSLLMDEWKGARHVVVSEQRRDELVRLLGISAECIKVIPNGIDVARFFKLEEVTRQLVRRLNLLEAAPLLLLPVRLTPRKNIELAMHILASLQRRIPEARLLVTGPLGPHNPANVAYFERLRVLRQKLGLESSVWFLAEEAEGFLPDEVIADFYRLADTLLLPSREEGFGIPILEAGISGLPIFCTDISPFKALAGEQAYYFSPDEDPERVAELIEQRFRSEPILKMRLRVRQGFVWENIYWRYIAPILEASG